MLTSAIVLIVVWGVGLTSGYTLGGLLHVLPVAAVIMISMRYTERLARRAPR
jgi:hypothetical protein